MPRAEQPLPDNTEPLTCFARDLRRLRVQAGSPPYRELARRSHYSPTTLADAAGGKRLPSLAATLAYVRACGGDTEPWEARWRQVSADLCPVPESGHREPDRSGKAPYVGLAAFQSEDSVRFFGREEIVRTLARRMDGQRFLALFGASGAGKSSVLRAGLLPARGDQGPVLLMTPGQRPVEECAVRLAAVTGGSAPTFRAGLAEGPDGLHLLARQLLDGRDGELLVVVDQFEEVFTLCADPAEREAFLALLLHAVRAETSRVRVLLGVRTDFLTHCAAHPELANALQDAQVLLGPMTADELREAVTRPALETGHRLESALLAVLMAEAAGRPGALPLLSHALLETWYRRRGNVLTLRGYQEAGGIAHALARTAETVYAGLDEAGQEIARDLFLRLTALGEGTEDTRRRVHRAELDSSPAAAHVVEALTAARLVTADGDTLEISHEVLLHAWPRLHDWLSADREGLRVHRQLTEAAATWESLHRDPAALYRGSRLDRALDWSDGETARPTTREREFLAASRRDREEETTRGRRRQRRQQQLVAAVLVFGLIAGLAALVAGGQWASAARQRDDATYRHVVAEADRLAEADPTLSARLLLAAHRLRPDDEAVHTRLLGTGTRPLATTTAAHPGRAYQVAYGKDGSWIATTGDDGTVRLWQVRDRQHLEPMGAPLTGGQGWLLSLRLNADSSLLVAVGQHGRALLWNVRDPRKPERLPDLPGPKDTHVYETHFHPGGRKLATAHSDGTVRLWDLTDPQRPVQEREWTVGARQQAFAVAFSQDGRTLAAAGERGAVHLWDLAQPNRAPRTVDTGSGSVLVLAFHPGGQVLVTGGREGVVRLWEVTTGAAVGLPLAGHRGDVWYAGFNARGDVLVTAGGDGAALLWNSTAPASVTRIGPPLSGSGSTVYAAALSPDGTVLATVANDGRIRLWDLPSALLLGHHQRVDSVSVRPDGGLVALADRGNVVRLWRTGSAEVPRQMTELPAPAHRSLCTQCPTQTRFTPDGRLLVVLTNTSVLRLVDVADPEHPVVKFEKVLGTSFTSALALSPDGRVLAVGEDDFSTRLWDISDPEQPKPLGSLAGHEGEVGVLVFRPDGKVIASMGTDSAVILWDVSDPRYPRRKGTARVEGIAGAMAFSPDGTVLAETSEEPRIWLWDVHDLSAPVRRPEPLTGHTKAVTAVRWSPDGRHLVTAGADHSVRQWRLTGPNRPAAVGEGVPISGGAGSVLAFLPGDRLLAGDGTNTVRVLDLSVPRAVERICRTADPLDEQRWRQHLPGLPYQRTCPGG